MYRGCGACGEEWAFGEPPTCKCKDRVTLVPKREWQGLTDEERENLWQLHTKPLWGSMQGINPTLFARAIEVRLKEKNCG
jgi:hypothetical protein